MVRIEAIGENKMGDITYTAILIPDEVDERLRWNMTAYVVLEQYTRFKRHKPLCSAREALGDMPGMSKLR